MDKSGRNELYGTTEDRINTFGQVEDSKAVYRVFGHIRTIAHEQNLVDDPDKTIQYMIETYGIKIKFLRDPALPRGGGWDMSFEIVNEELYTLFLLKYS